MRSRISCTLVSVLATCSGPVKLLGICPIDQEGFGWWSRTSPFCAIWSLYGTVHKLACRACSHVWTLWIGRFEFKSFPRLPIHRPRQWSKRWSVSSDPTRIKVQEAAKPGSLNPAVLYKTFFFRSTPIEWFNPDWCWETQRFSVCKEKEGKKPRKQSIELYIVPGSGTETIWCRIYEEWKNFCQLW